MSINAIMEDLGQLTIFDEFETQEVETVSVGDKVRVRQSAIDHAERTNDVENIYYLKEYRHAAGVVIKKDYAKKGAYLEVEFRGKRNAIFNITDVKKIER